MRLSELLELPEHHHCQAIAAQPADASHGQQESLHHHLTGAEIFTPYSAGSVSVARGVTRTQIHIIACSWRIISFFRYEQVQV